jgi:hypothetical protein
MIPEKTVLLLDVDGVLNAFSTGYESRKVWVGSGGAIHPTKVTKPFLKWAWEQFEVFWLTAWFGRANEIADWARLPHRPHLGDPSTPGDYKLFAVQERLGTHTGKVVWLEDGIGKDAQDWVGIRKNFLYIETDPFKGVTRQQIAKMAKFAGATKLAAKST